MTDQPEPIALSNTIRLSARQWVLVALFAVAFVNLSPTVWSRYEDFTLEPDYRMPHELSGDYWLFERFAALAVQDYDTLVIGDSVVWGEYVTRQQTLPHYLNRLAGKERFANLGLDGAHPLALLGLVRHYTGSVRNHNVVLECNPLWLTSLKADLQDARTERVNHERLLPQFWPRIPAYKEKIEPRLGIVVEQRVAFSQWVRHLQAAYYQDEVNRPRDLPSWTLQHPYEDPLEPLTRGLPASGNELRHLQQPWFKNNAKIDPPWIDLDTSLQWHAFQQVVELLRARGNRVFVVVGPFNEHMLTAASLKRYGQVKDTIAAWLEEKQIPYTMPTALASKLYGDASHPLPAGYAELARVLYKEPFFFQPNR